MKILLVGGTWDFNNGKASKLVDSVYDCIGQYIIKNCLDIDIEFYNGGNYEDLKKIISLAPMFDFVFWWANVSNELPKIRNVKEIAPFTMLVIIFTGLLVYGVAGFITGPVSYVIIKALVIRLRCEMGIE